MTSTQKPTNPLFTRQALVALLLPLIAEQALSVTIGLADTLMVSSVGEAAVSGVSLVDSFNTLMIQVMSALATGGAVVTSQYIGHREPKNAKAAAKPKKETFEPAEPVEDFGFVAVAAGEGLKNLFKDLGCANVVSGGQSMNPSTDDIYAAVMATPAKNVLVFPNNKNIILAAEQTIPMVKDRNVVIVPTRTIPQGMTALLNFDSEISPESNAQLMMDAATGVGTGLVTFAARNSEFGGKKIKEGDIIALENGKLTITEKNPVKAVVKLAKNMVTRDTSFITLIYGNDISEEDAKTAFNELSDKFGSRTDVTLVKGDQPVYYFILSVE